jgi:multicomponent K+:H+ antiporter subunit A/multicomponent Na+:H+ antiporter subunit A
MVGTLSLILLGWPLLAALFFALCGKRVARVCTPTAVLVPLVPLFVLVELARGLETGPSTITLFTWVPALGLDVSLLFDGLSLFYGFVVTGVGVLVFFYAGRYFDPEDPRLGRFFASLSLFMAAMLGTVLSNNFLMLLVFWEMTGLASFLLIGFDHGKESSRAGARMALLVTMATGLCLLCGIAMIGWLAGTLDIRLLSEVGLPAGPHGDLATAALLLLLLGAFGKSAQFPFHFWLPNAMSAPTPVSAYLHSATMVKLGVFLTARIYPVFHESEIWMPVLGTISFGTMLIGAWMAFRSHDLKAILAFSTVSQLGFLIGFYGLGSSLGVRFDFVHISNHVFYKACLFMLVGIVDHATGVRDIRQLGGLRHRLPWLAVAGAVGCASMAGLPLTLGFISKEIMLADLLAVFRNHQVAGPVFCAMVVLASVFKVAFAARLFFHVFCGREPEEVAHHFHHPGRAIQIPCLLLAGAALFFGIFPGWLEQPNDLLRLASLHAPDGGYLSLWHGFTAELAVSVGIVVVGLAFYFWQEKRGWPAGIPAWAAFDRFFETGVKQLPVAARNFSRALCEHRPHDYLPLLLLFVLVSMAGWLVSGPGADLSARAGAAVVWESSALTTGVVLVMCASCLVVAISRVWTTQLIALSVVGLFTTFYFVLYRAPDLALTQILVESATLLGVLLLLARFPASARKSSRERTSSTPRLVLNLVLAGGTGGLVALLCLAALAFRHPDPLGNLYPAATLPLAKGSNAVNTILIDFRGFDTLGEICVLLIAVLGAVGLLMRYRRTEEERRQGEKGPAGFGYARSKEEGGAP